MKNLKFVLGLFIMAAFLFTGCNPLKVMQKLAEDQQNQVTPDPLEVHADKVDFEVEVVVPQGMLKKGTMYTVEFSYNADDKETVVGTVDIDSDNYPDNASNSTRIAEKFSFPYQEGMGNGQLSIKGKGKIKASGKEGAVLPKTPIAKGLITTSGLVQDVYHTAYADHGYNDGEELIPTRVEFFFEKGSPALRYSEKRSDRGKKFSAFIAEKNVTRTVTITGAHSPEGLETVNTNLASKRAEAIESYYRKEMKKYDYKGMADSIKFILKPVVRDWTAFKSALKAYDKFSAEEKSAITKIVNGSGSFEDKEKELQKLKSYSKLMKDVYPPLRTAKTEVLTVKVKKSKSEISVLSKEIVKEKVSADTLSMEELLYSATLTPDLGEKRDIYMAATKKGSSWVAHNNLGATYLDLAIEASGTKKTELIEKAIAQVEIAAKMKSTSITLTNLGTAYIMQMNYDQANETLAKALAASPSGKLVKGIKGAKGGLEIRTAEYDVAVSTLSSGKETSKVSFNRGLALLLSGEYQNAKTAFKNASSIDEEMGLAYYGAAIASARLKEEKEVVSFLKKAIDTDKSFKKMALDDLEFSNFAVKELIK